MFQNNLEERRIFNDQYRRKLPGFPLAGGVPVRPPSDCVGVEDDGKSRQRQQRRGGGAAVKRQGAAAPHHVKRHPERRRQTAYLVSLHAHFDGVERVPHQENT